LKDLCFLCFKILHIPLFFVNCSARYCNTWSFPRVLFKIVSTCTTSLCWQSVSKFRLYRV